MTRSVAWRMSAVAAILLAPILVALWWIDSGSSKDDVETAAKADSAREHPPTPDQSLLTVHSARTMDDAVARLRGRILAPGDRPCRDAALCVLDSESRRLWNGRSDASGEFSVDGLPDQSLRMVVEPTDRDDETHEIPHQGFVVLRIGFDEGSDLEDSDLDAILRGRVTDRNGLPIPSFALRLAADREIPHQIHSRAPGEFEIRLRLPTAEMLVDLMVSATGYSERTATDLLVRKGEATGPFDLVLAPIAALVHGIVVDENAQPIESATVSIRTIEAATARPTRTRSDGRFAIQAAESCRLLTLLATKSGYAPRVVDLREQATRDELRVELRSSERAGAVRGRVQDASGSPLGFCAVQAWLDLDTSAEFDEWTTQTKTDANGEFQLTGLPEAPLWLARINASGARQNAVRCTPASGTTLQFDLVLSGHHVLKGTPRSVGREGLHEIRLRPVESPSDRWSAIFLAPMDREFALDHLPSGAFILEIHYAVQCFVTRCVTVDSDVEQLGDLCPTEEEIRRFVEAKYFGADSGADPSKAEFPATSSPDDRQR